MGGCAAPSTGVPFCASRKGPVGRAAVVSVHAHAGDACPPRFLPPQYKVPAPAPGRSKGRGFGVFVGASWAFPVRAERGVSWWARRPASASMVLPTVTERAATEWLRGDELRFGGKGRPGGRAPGSASEAPLACPSSETARL